MKDGKEISLAIWEPLSSILEVCTTAPKIPTS